jgi:membrane protein YqaA with SNARE-associated domain
LRFLSYLNEYLLVMGIPGLLAISFLDSAAVPMAGGPDALILLLAWRRPGLTYLIVLAATVGSALGCMILYGIGRKGGEKALSRINPEKTAWIEKKMQEYGAWVVVAAVLAPPPFPTKPVILAAGVLRTGKMRFASGVFVGRLLRYSLLGYLGAEFGDRSVQVLKAHYPTIALILLGLIVLVVLIRTIGNRTKLSNP